MADVEKIIAMNKEGFSNKEIADKLSTEDEPLSYQAVAKIVKENSLVHAELVENVKGCVTMSAEEYSKYSKANGRTAYGGEKGVKVNATVEELRVYINSGWKPSMLLEKWQMTEDELTQLTWKLALSELRDRQPVVNFKQDFFRF